MRVEKRSLVDALVKELTERIRKGIYKPGGKLPSERLLQVEFGVGRLALREALSRLNAVGVIATSHGRGTFVQEDVESRTVQQVLAPYFALQDSARLRDLVDARMMIEGEIAWQVAGNRTTDDLERLRAIVDHGFAPDVSLAEVARQDLLFHAELAGMVENRFLTVMHEALLAHIESFLTEFVKSKENAAAVMEAHRPILAAIEQGDSEAAWRLARLHVSYSMQDYEEFVRNQASGRSEE